jgi:hypothetical protein
MSSLSRATLEKGVISQLRARFDILTLSTNICHFNFLYQF